MSLLVKSDSGGSVTSAFASPSRYKPSSVPPPHPLTRTPEHNSSPHSCPPLPRDENPGRCWSNVTVFPPGERPCHTTSASQSHLEGGGIVLNNRRGRKEACCSHVVTQKHLGYVCLLVYEVTCSHRFGLMRLMLINIFCISCKLDTRKIVCSLPPFLRTILDL